MKIIGHHETNRLASPNSSAHTVWWPICDLLYPGNSSSSCLDDVRSSNALTTMSCGWAVDYNEMRTLCLDRMSQRLQCRVDRLWYAADLNRCRMTALTLAATPFNIPSASSDDLE